MAVDLSSPQTVAALRETIASDHPALAPGLAASRIAVDSEFRDDDYTIPAGAEVAVIPPVSGG